MRMPGGELGAVAVCAALLLCAPAAAAQDGSAGRGSAPSAEEETDPAGAAVSALASTDRETLQRALETIERLEHTPAVAPIAERIRRGLPRDLLRRAVETLGRLGRPEAGPVLVELARHRRAEIRAAAVEALVATRPEGVRPVLVRRLADPSPRVRGAAAVGLGALEARDAVDALLSALAAGVPQAGPVVGRLASAEEVPQVVALLERHEVSMLLPALRAILERSELPEAARLSVLGGLEEVPGPEVLDLLGELVESERLDDPIREAAAELLERLEG